MERIIASAAICFVIFCEVADMAVLWWRKWCGR